MYRSLIAVGLFAAATAFAASDPTYVALRAARPDGRVIDVKDFAVDRDAYHISLTGALYPLAPESQFLETVRAVPEVHEKPIERHMRVDAFVGDSAGAACVWIIESLHRRATAAIEES